jgi:hypothetical protein
VNPEHLPCVAIILAVCAVVLCVALSFWIDGWKRNCGAGRGVGELLNPTMGDNSPKRGNSAGTLPRTCPGPYPVTSGTASANLAAPTRTIPNEQAKRRAMLHAINKTLK